jgi:hypothetical protein
MGIEGEYLFVKRGGLWQSAGAVMAYGRGQERRLARHGLRNECGFAVST